MIIDYIQNFGTYISINKQLEDGFVFIETIKDMPVGRYERGNMYALVQEGGTNPIEAGIFESHRKYIDIQYLVEGKEILEWNNTINLDEIISYDESKDAAFYSGSGKKVNLDKDMFYILFSHDGHKCCVHYDKQTTYRKVVLKLKI
jgi:YhcH/YjgK/YiaL family protein